MKNANLKALLDNLRNATEFLNSAKADAASDFNGVGRDAREWMQTAALELGCALIAQHDLGIGALRAEIEREREYRGFLQSANAGLAEKVERLGGDLDAARAKVTELERERCDLRNKLAHANLKESNREEQKPVGFVRVIAGEISRYSWNQGVTLPEGKHQLYATPVAQPETAGDDHE